VAAAAVADAAVANHALGLALHVCVTAVYLMVYLVQLLNQRQKNFKLLKTLHFNFEINPPPKFDISLK